MHHHVILWGKKWFLGPSSLWFKFNLDGSASLSLAVGHFYILFFPDLETSDRFPSSCLCRLLSCKIDLRQVFSKGDIALGLLYKIVILHSPSAPPPPPPTPHNNNKNDFIFLSNSPTYTTSCSQ